ncbi:hypothetical protein OPT61_g7160 [Boeremia exigua]|uniref:Uncharacterized protein n=1 Tax=Boeremia exigua TaxID=749465 RepID=A0ACC2I512_9PLEO|nr:hypothetical protein OPT61_g7160 [Boeremia exigua]
MSKWRQKGFVQDSDEEEDESQIESQPPEQDKRFNGRVERVPKLADVQNTENRTGPQAYDGMERVEIAVKKLSEAKEDKATDRTPQRHASLQRPSLSPITLSAKPRTQKERSESPDPLYSSPSARRRPQRSVTPRSPTCLQSSQEEIQLRAFALPSQILGESEQSVYRPSKSAAGKDKNGSAILCEFGLAALSDNSEDELNLRQQSDSESNLSDYPPDLSDTEPQPTAYATPHRRTAVQVLIPSSTALQHQLAQEEAMQRNFRQRKPIQLHPYVLEGERYRREVQSRGLKPVPQERSPPRRQGQDNTEPQEEEFNPFGDNQSSPPDPEIFVSTPALPQARNDTQRIRTQRGSPSIRLRVPKTTKRRRLNGSLSQALATPARTSENSPVPLDICARRSAGNLRRSTKIIPSDQSLSESEASSSASEQEDGELHKVGRRIRGVLPASWLRIDRQAQERRQMLSRQRARSNFSQSPEPAGPQRGIAHRVTKSYVRPGGLARTDSAPGGVVVISDESDHELKPATYRQANNSQSSTEDASRLAALFDNRYANSDDDLASMEHDRLHLPTLGGSGTKRKHQTRITDVMGNTKRRRTSTPIGLPKSSRISKPVSATTARRQRDKSRRPHSTHPALSVMDADLPTDVPQFLKLARRAARRDVNQARQSPSRKQIRLHTAQDTEDANATLRQWKQGLLKPRVKPLVNQQRSNRPPLAATTDNQQYLTSHTNDSDKHGNSHPISVPPLTNSSTRHPYGRKTVPPALQVLRRTLTSLSRPSRPKRIAKVTKELERSIQQGPGPFRAAQLEGDERRFGHSHRKIAFQKGLQHVEQQCSTRQDSGPQFMNPQLARFLADDKDVSPPLPPATDVGEHQDTGRGGVNTTSSIRHSRHRRKPQAIRLDTDARQFRQPSEPTFEPIPVVPTHTPSEQNRDALLGLEPPGTRYPISFDIMPLKGDTYFNSDTFVGSEDLQRALWVGKVGTRDLDEPAGYCVISYGLATIRCGPWCDETYSQVSELLMVTLPPLDDSLDQNLSDRFSVDGLTSLSKILRALVAYISNHLSFSDPIDRKDFAMKMRHLIQTLFDRVSTIHTTTCESQVSPEQVRVTNRILSYLLVVGTQVYQIARHTIDPGRMGFVDTMRNISEFVVHAILQGTKELYDFHERNKLHKEREKGVQSHDVVVEAIVISMHALELLDVPCLGFWDLVSQELTKPLLLANHSRIFENVWMTIFSLLPFIEFDLLGIPDRIRLRDFDRDNWTCICILLKRVLDFYHGTSRLKGTSVNDYIRVNLRRCYVLINEWHWSRPDQILNVIFDFFGQQGLKPLRHETATGSANFLHDFGAPGSLALTHNDNSFQIALKCLATGLQGMNSAYPEKKLRSFVFRRIPNHGRTYPKDQQLQEESLAALRNHHDLLSTLYCAVPAPCRPKMDRIRDLVSHETSHREACRVGVRAWANLATFQLSMDESYAATKPFALWYKDIMHQTLRQYRSASAEAEDYLRSAAFEETTKAAAVLVKQTVESNQEQVIATLRDSIAGMKHAIQRARDHNSLTTFLVDSDIVHLLELPHLKDRRLVNVIRDTLSVIRQYASMQKTRIQQQVSQPKSEESQDYGDFPDLDDLDDLDDVNDQAVPQSSRLDFIQKPLWHLMSNAFGAEHQPDDNLLMDCIDTWVLVASDEVTCGSKDWSHYINVFSQMSWQQLRPTEQTRKFAPYFMATLIACDQKAYKEHQTEFLTALLLCLADRESMLRFQHRLLTSIVVVDDDHPLLRNLPFFMIEESRSWDITADTLRSRRLALISSLLSNMREHVYLAAVEEPAYVPQLKSTYATMLMDFMVRLKNNYQQLQQGAVVAGAYVEFVQKIVQFLKQYTSDICPVLPFFTDSAAFPLPSTDPMYVVGILCGYAPKVDNPGTTKQLASFIQTVSQQAVNDNQQVYLRNQLTSALCSNDASIADREALRTILLQGIFPAYIESAFTSRIGHIIARSILECLPGVFDGMVYDLRINQIESVSRTVQSVVTIAHAFIKGTEHLKGDVLRLEDPSILNGLVRMFEVAMSISRLLDYLLGRTFNTTGPTRIPLITYLDEFSLYLAQMIEGGAPSDVPSYRGDADAAPFDTQYADILSFCTKDLQSTIESNWGENQDSIWFGQGQAKRVVVCDIGSPERERSRHGAITTDVTRPAVWTLLGSPLSHDSELYLATWRRVAFKQLTLSRKMPSRKKQKTGKDSSAAAQAHEDGQPGEQQEAQPEPESSTAQEQTNIDDTDDSDSSGPKPRDTKTIPEHEYIGMHRPHFDYNVENRTLGQDAKEDENFFEYYSECFNAENKAGVMLEPAKDHPDHKWVIMWKGYKMFMDYRRRSNYCCPDRFGMYISNDFEGWGYQELIENFIVEFDSSLKKKGDSAIKDAWAVVSAISLWINEVDQGPLINNEYGEKTQALIGLVGHALLRCLAALDFAKQLKPDTDFLDIPITITSLLHFTDGLSDYGIEADEWRPHAAAYFEKGKFAHEKGMFNSAEILKKATGGSVEKLAKKTDKDPWGWNKMLKGYKREHGTGAGGGKIGGTEYDITRMSRKKRASYADDGKDPLADVSEKDLKEGNLDFA